MDKVYKHQEVEKKWYAFWEKEGFFTPKTDPKKKPYTIIMPPPNANGYLHIGHAAFLTLEDIMIRYHRMKGEVTLWLPGADHAGILTQVVFERKLEKEEHKSRFDLGREEFVRRSMEFTLKNKEVMERQMKAIGASCDWSRESFTLDPKFNKPIYQTFKNLYDDGFLYRDFRMINWCVRCSTALSDLEVVYKEKKDPLYYIKYGPFVLATVRPETKFGDTAVAVHPQDRRYQKYIGKEIKAEGLLGKFSLKVIADQAVDPKFGTGVVKVTPAHDPDDFAMGQRHHLEVKQVIDFDGRLNNKTGPYKGMTVEAARKKTAEDLKKKGLIEKIDFNYSHNVAVCERCQTIVEPLVSLQWFIKTKPLAQRAMESVKKGEIKFKPERFEKNFFIWMENIRDWCISRQLWWGHRIPVWYCGKKNLSQLQLLMNPELTKIKDEGCGEIIVSAKTPQTCPKCLKTNLIQDPDTLDTWFSSGQWPYTTLGFAQDDGRDFEYFYPTSVMETGYEILFFWVARMIMLGLYSTGKVPFKLVYLHGLVRDAFGQKMSKSKGNVIDPLTVIDEYGADSLRMSLVYGTSVGSDVKLSEKKIEAMRNFGNKIWNMARFIKMNMEFFEKNNKKFNPDINYLPKNSDDKNLLKKFKMLTKLITKNMDTYRFAPVAEILYNFLWHELADIYIEKVKERLKNNDYEALNTLYQAYMTCMVMLHPFMPHITEEINKKLTGENAKPLIITPWPKNER
ncbi:valine--tRNA ligase [Candidatus Gottesmanbacteria bacterium RIFCSPHIGHO2_02_FULL_39_14]|uniref:Valine--tRNA ligase n=1 Tax=Candidatus Gottesmanbacteria bacterium RIFCSPHIGHO2_02_FULL_39_14 TaxID=1798383 RepID=A0A1F6A2D7_9BACT|nr:MAG: valine--tRNA ligase [Candidatus Gottesmanbacteria bacterium RIFCSPHIGHO2_02_FULL_39_14]